MFDNDFRRIMLAGGEGATRYRQHLVSKMSEKCARDGSTLSADDLERQRCFVSGDADIGELLNMARDIARAGI